MNGQANIDPATERVLAGIYDEELAARYPDRAHFISAEDPNHGEMATRALFSGDPVVIVYPDGHELLVRPEQVAGVVAVLLLFVTLFTKLLRRKRGDLIQLPPRARIEARDSAGHSLAA
ncbi:MAG TPA: hypothetical protein VFY04_04280 [Solirubrobacterales bacterium]|nr:hypothetical protein [Solirubrobacterales bacterium]